MTPPGWTTRAVPTEPASSSKLQFTLRRDIQILRQFPGDLLAFAIQVRLGLPHFLVEHLHGVLEALQRLLPVRADGVQGAVGLAKGILDDLRIDGGAARLP